MYITKNKGFTLVELLVVISVISLLMAILMPALQKVREQSRRTACASNLHQIAIAEITYSCDEGKLFPRYVTSLEIQNDAHIDVSKNVNTVVPFAMTKSFYDYMKNRYGLNGKSWVCPSLAAHKGGNREFLVDQPFVDDYGFAFQKGDLLPRHMGSDIWPYPTVGLGYANLAGMCNMKLTSPAPDVPDSACRVTDPSYKLLAADLNLRWTSWNDTLSAVGHKDKSGMPAGGNRASLDGSVTWRNASQLGKDDGPVDEDNEPKFQHARGRMGLWNYPRAYYW